MSNLILAYQALAALGWQQSLGRDAKGKAYLAFTKDGEWLHITADSASGPRQSVEPYGEGRTANIVKHPLLAEMDLKTCEGGGE